MKFFTLGLFCSFAIFTTALSAQSDEAIPIHGFFDLGARYNTKEQKSKYSTGFLDFYFTKSLNNKIDILIDVVFETIDNAYAVDVERLNIRYSVNEYLTITSGKFHTPYGYWNTAFHHGLQIQTSILRPKFVAFEDRGGVLPSHSVGFIADGYIGDFSYKVYTSSGMSIVQENTNTNTPGNGTIATSNGEHQDGNKLFGATLAYDFDETEIGIHTFRQDVNIFNNRMAEVFMYGGFIAMELDNFELYSEAYLFYNKNESQTKEEKILSSQAYYLQVAYDFDGIKPYARVEYTHYNEEDSYFSSQRLSSGSSYDREALGLNFSLAEDANLKVALMRTNSHPSNISYDLLSQFAIRF